MTLALATLLAIACACGPSRPGGTDPARTPAAAPPPTFLARLGAAHTAMVYLGDPLPRVERVLGSDALARVLARPEVAALFDDPPDLAAMRQRVQAAAPWIPREVALGFSGSGVEVVGRALRLIVIALTCQAASGASERSTQRELPALQELLLEEVRATRVPHAVAWARMRTAGAAARLFEMAAGLARQTPPAIAKVRVAATEITLAIDVAAVMKPEELTDLMVAARLLSDPSDAVMRPLVDAIRRIRVRVVLARDGDELRLTIGDGTKPAPGPRADTAELTQLFAKDSPDMAAWARWDVGPFATLMAGAVELLDRLRDTEAGAAMLAADDEDIAGDVRDLQRDLSRAPARGQLRFDLGDVARLEMIEYGPPAATPLARTGLLAMVPPDAPIVSLSSIDSVGDSLAGVLENVEQRLAKNSLKQLLTDGGDTANETEQRYYRQFAALRKLVLRDSRQVFAPPLAHVMTTSTAVAGLTVEIGGGPGAKPRRETVRDVPIPEYAIIGKTDDPARALRWVESVYREAAHGALDLLHLSIPPGSVLIAPRDLGLGVPTHALSLGWLRSATGSKFAVDIRGDLALHCFARGDYFVISTSPALSRRILNAEDPVFALSDPTLVRYGRLPAAPIAGYLARLASWLRTVDPSPGLQTGLEVAVALLGTIDAIEWQGRDQGGLRLTRAELRFAAAP